MSVKIGMVSLGCAKNQVDAELLMGMIRRDYEICGDESQCDAVIINTCAFIEDAKKESIETIFDYVRMKDEGRLKAVVVTGCLAERYRQQVAEEIPEVDAVVGIGGNARILEVLDSVLRGEKRQVFGEKTELSLEGERVLANAPYFAYLKVAEGCSNRCAYCAIPLIRGDFRSRPMEKVVAEAEKMAEQGVVELNVVAQDTTRYGEDLCGKSMLPELLTRLCRIDKIHWVRILYCYPDRITDALLEVMAREDKIVKYMDVPIQHASGRVLRAMNRKGDSESLIALTDKIRKKVPGVVLRTTLIAGFPGETEADFEELCEFVRRVRFERLGCFPYSLEEDTPAAEMDGQLDEEVKIRRAGQLMEIQYGIAAEVSEKFRGRTLEVLVEGREHGRWRGRSYGDAPDIDSRVYFTGKKHYRPGQFVLVTVTGRDGYDLIGKAAAEDESAK